MRTAIILVVAMLTSCVNRPSIPEVCENQSAITVNSKSQGTLLSEVQSYYEQWKSAYLVYESAQDYYRVNHNIGYLAGSSTSESQSYGMLITAQMEAFDPSAREYFDGMYRLVANNNSYIDDRLMSFKWPPDEPPSTGTRNSATDGDIGIAYALLIAHDKWGSDGAIDYFAEAMDIMGGLKQSAFGATSHLPMLGDWVSEWPGSSASSCAAGTLCEYNEWSIRPSDCILPAFRAFYAASADPFWLNALVACQAALDGYQTGVTPVSGLVPDYLVRCDQSPATTAPDGFNWGAYDGEYSYNSARVPFWIGMDAVESGDTVSADISGRLFYWIGESCCMQPSLIRAGYRIPELTAIGMYSTAAFSGPFASSAMAAGNQQFLNDLYEMNSNTWENGYFEDTLNLMSQIYMVGIWTQPNSCWCSSN